MTVLLTQPSEFASQIELRTVATSVPYSQNALAHSNRQVRQIADSIRSFGFLKPVLIDAAG